MQFSLHDKLGEHALGTDRRAENMQAFSTPSVLHGKHRCFTEANGAFQAGQTGRRRAHYIAKVNRENFACREAISISTQSVGLVRSDRREPGV